MEEERKTRQGKAELGLDWPGLGCLGCKPCLERRGGETRAEAEHRPDAKAMAIQEMEGKE